ncbi:hypothetical protein PTKIN_Ptkin19aG0028800 [Pterospermum kingtungense]
MVDTRKFSVSTLQRLINKTWKFRDKVTKVGRHHFNDIRDLYFLWLQGLWSLEGALFVFTRWSPSIDLSSFNPSYIPVWVQFWGLPLEYQSLALVLNIGQMIGEVLQIDWDVRLQRNNRVMRARVNVKLDQPLVDGCMFNFIMEYQYRSSFNMKDCIKFVKSVELWDTLLPISSF